MMTHVMSALRPPRAFLSYAHEDERYLRKFLLALGPLLRSNRLLIWFDNEILPTEKWSERIERQLETMDLFIPLISPSYGGSEACAAELARALDREAAGEIAILPILISGHLRPELSKFEALPPNAKPVVDWRPQDSAFAEIQRGIEAFVENLEPTPSMLVPDDAAELFHAINSVNYAVATLPQWQTAFWDLYGGCDDAVPLYTIVLQIVADATRLAEAVRKGNYGEALPFIPRIFSWVVNLTTKLNQPAYSDLGVSGGLDEIVWRKYPRVCSLCARSECICPILRIDTKTLSERDELERDRHADLVRARLSNDRPVTLDDWVDMFAAIYGMAHARLSLQDKTLHFFEEIGEVEVELRRADRIRRGMMQGNVELADEIADVFSWLASIMFHMKRTLEGWNNFLTTFEDRERARREGGAEQLESAGVPEQGTLVVPSLSQWIWREFGSSDGFGLRCHVCEELRCSCEILLERR